MHFHDFIPLPLDSDDEDNFPHDIDDRSEFSEVTGAGDDDLIPELEDRFLVNQATDDPVPELDVRVSGNQAPDALAEDVAVASPTDGSGPEIRGAALPSASRQNIQLEKLPDPGPDGSVVAFINDNELTGSIRALDRIIDIAMLAVLVKVENGTKTGRLLSVFNSRINNEGKNITAKAFEVHGISENDLRGLPGFKDVGQQLVAWMNGLLGPNDVGVLVSHNVLVDVQFLMVEFERAGLHLPAQVQHCICTEKMTKKAKIFSSVKKDKWSWFTPKGQKSLSVKGIVDHLLEHHPERIKLEGCIGNRNLNFGNGEKRFDTVCGNHHDSVADAIGCAIVLFDEKGILLSDKDMEICTPIQPIREAMKAKLSNPITHDPVHDPFVEVGSGVLGDCGVQVEIEDKSTKPAGPSDALKAHLDFDEDNPPVGFVQLVFDIFKFFFRLNMLQMIVQATNEHATEEIFKSQTFRGPPRNEEEAEQTSPRCLKWSPLTVGELWVFIGIIFLMGAEPRKRNSHFWKTPPDGQGPHPTISLAMQERRFQDIMSHLSFMTRAARATEFLGDKLRKIRQLSNDLLSNFQEAWNEEQLFVIDESMVATCSRFCGFVQNMPSKPISCGIKIFCLCFAKSKYLYNYHVFTGSDGNGFVRRLLCNILIPASWNHTGKSGFCDNYFTSIATFRELLSRGIFMTGPSKAARPATQERRGPNSQPFQSYDKNHVQLVGGRGWMRQCYQTVTNASAIIIGYLTLTVWADNRFLVMLSTAYFGTTNILQRWSREMWKRIDVTAPIAVFMYQKFMGAVDHMDKVVAATGIRMKRCKKRYHRTVFLGFLVVAYHNAVVAAKRLIAALVLEKLQNSHGITEHGFFHWTQLQFGKMAIEFGLAMARAEIESATPEETPRKRKLPHFLPRDAKRQRVTPPPSPVAEEPANHSKVAAKVVGNIDNRKRGYCFCCLKKGVDWRTPVGGKKKKPYRKGTNIPLRRLNKQCSICCVHLCDDCFEGEWDHAKQAPL